MVQKGILAFLQAGAGLLEVARKLETSIGERYMIFVRLGCADKDITVVVSFSVLAISVLGGTQEREEGVSGQLPCWQSCREREQKERGGSASGGGDLLSYVEFKVGC